MINEELKKSYKSIFDDYDFTELQKYSELSNIFLIKSDQSDKPQKIMIIGQETRGWYGSFQDGQKKDISYIDKLMGYERCNIAKKNPKSAFLNFFQKAEKYFNKNKDLELIWANLFCMSNNKKSPKKHPAFNQIKLLSKLLLKQQLNIIKPKIILFVTGPSNDKYIKDFFEITSGKISSINESKWLWHFTIGDTACFRVTHPRFRAGKSTRDKALLYINEYLASCYA